MEIKEVTNKHEWESFVSSQQPTSLLQSWSWRELMFLEGRQPKCLAVWGRGEVSAAALVVSMKLPLGQYYLYAPRGPIFKTGLEAHLKEQALRDLANYLRSKHKQALFLRCDAAIAQNELNYYRLGFRKSSKEVQPKQTLILNLHHTEETLLAKMKPKTRYNIKLAEKKDILVTVAKDEQDLQIFYELLRKTSVKDGFRLHPYKHYLNLWQSLYPDNLRIFLAHHKQKTVAAIMVANYADTCTYLHGASDYDYRRLMAPYLLHWQAIREAKRNGYTYYDFWGVAPRASKNHPWEGITRFKEGFGGSYHEYAGAHDLVFRSFWYNLYLLVKAIRSKSLF